MKTIIKKSAQKKVTDIVTSQKKPRPANEPTSAEQIANLEDIKAIEDEIGNFNNVDVTYHISSGTVVDNLVALDHKIGTASDGTYFHDSNSVADNLLALDAIIGTNSAGTYIVGNSIFEDLLTLDNEIHNLNSSFGDLSSTVSDMSSTVSDMSSMVGYWSAGDAQYNSYITGDTIASALMAVDGYLSSAFSEIDTLRSDLQSALSLQYTDLAIAMTSASGSGNVATVYTISQGSNTVGTINIPKDFLVRSATLQTVATADTPYTGAVVGDKYIDFVINVREGEQDGDEEHIYLPVNDLVDVYTAQQNATQVQLSIGSDNVISATLVDSGVTTAKIADSAVTTAKIADGAVTTDKIAIADTVRSDTNWTLVVSNGRLVLRQLA